MNRSIRLLVGLASVTAAVAVTLAPGLLGSAAAAASSSSSSLPADAAAKGYIGLCNETGQNVTGGSIDTRPFVWKAVTSSAPLSAYQGHGQNAVLGIFQPRTGTLPVEWGGTPLTAASYYRQKATPSAQATYSDQSLRSVIKRFPPEVDGLYVLRMYFGRAGYGTVTTAYPTTTIQVTGSSWRVVAGGTVNCHAASAVSNEQLTGVAGTASTTPRRPSSTERTVDTARARVISVSAGSIRAQAPNSNSSGISGPGRSQSINASPASDTSHSSTSVIVWVLVGVVIALVLVLGAVIRSRRTVSRP